MSLSISNNIMSLTAQNSLSKTSNMLATSLQRLSTGLKINSGADGPAALVISEEQKAQIAGLKQAITNTSNAVSMVQTTEGALNEVNSLLTQIRSLALDSANSAVNDSAALAANQSQVASALATINSIAQNTQFGTKKLLDGTLGASVARTDVTDANITSQVTTGLANVNLADGNYKLKITTAYVAPQVAVAAKNGATGSLITNTVGTAGTFFNAAANGLGANVAATAVTNAAFFTDNGNIVIGNNVYGYTAGQNVGTVLSGINDPNFTISLNDATNKFSVVAKTAGAASNNVQVQILGASHQGTLAATSGGADAIAKVAVAGEITDAAGNSLASPILLTAISASDGTVLQNAALGIQFDVDNTAAATTGDKGAVYNVATTGSAAIFQIGANAGQTASLSISNSDSSHLGTAIVGNQFASLNAIDVTTQSGAQDALAVIDKAISQVSTQRANLGAFQTNTLQANANNLSTALTNTTSAESAIADTDFAVETANFTKNQVLMQVGTTVLQQANATSQLILNLLK